MIGTNDVFNALDSYIGEVGARCPFCWLPLAACAPAQPMARACRAALRWTWLGGRPRTVLSPLTAAPLLLAVCAV